MEPVRPSDRDPDAWAAYCAAAHTLEEHDARVADAIASHVDLVAMAGGEPEGFLPAEQLDREQQRFDLGWLVGIAFLLDRLRREAPTDLATWLAVKHATFDQIAAEHGIEPSVIERLALGGWRPPTTAGEGSDAPRDDDVAPPSDA